MAWYAELKRRKQWGICGLYMNHWYSKKLYDDWYNSLTEEELEALAEYRRKEKEKSEHELKQSVTRLLQFGMAMADIYARRM